MSLTLVRGFGHPAAERSRFGYRKLGVMLEREGRRVNHKRLHMLYREEWADTYKEVEARICDGHQSAASRAPTCSLRYSMDFMIDSPATGRGFRTFNIVDDYYKRVPDHRGRYFAAGRAGNASTSSACRERAQTRGHRAW